MPTPPNQCPYQVSTSHTLRFPRYSPDKIFKLKVTTARSNPKSDHAVVHLHLLTNVSLPSINFLHLTVSEIQLRQTFSHHLSAHPDTMGENNTPTALKGCGVKTAKFYFDTICFMLAAGDMLEQNFISIPD